MLFTVFFNRSQAREYWKSQAVFLAATLVLCAAAWCAARLVPLDGLPGLAAKGVAAAVAASAVLFAMFRADVRTILDILRKGRRRRS